MHHPPKLCVKTSIYCLFFQSLKETTAATTVEGSSSPLSYNSLFRLTGHRIRNLMRTDTLERACSGLVVLRVGFWHWLDSILALISSGDPLPAFLVIPWASVRRAAAFGEMQEGFDHTKDVELGRMSQVSRKFLPSERKSLIVFIAVSSPIFDR
jgi:hypothetical protein